LDRLAIELQAASLRSLLREAKQIAILLAGIR
jgi:hypothetical protein